MGIYALRRVNDETARTVAGAVTDSFEVETVRIRGLAEATRVSGNEEVVPEGETGYFEDDVDGENLDQVVDALGSLTRVVFYADSPVFAWFEDGKVRFRGDDEVLEKIRDAGIEASVADETPKSVVAEMTDDE